MFDKVTGSDSTRRALQNRQSAGSIVDSWKSTTDTFLARRRKYLLYPEPSAPKPSSKRPARSTPAR